MMGRVDLFLDELQTHGLDAQRSGVAAIISGSGRRGHGRAAHRQSPRPAGMSPRTPFANSAQASASTLLLEAPGADLMDLPATHTVQLGLSGRTVAGLAIVVELASSAHAPDPQGMQQAAGQAPELLKVAPGGR